MGSLSCVTRLDVLVDEKFYLEEFMSQMPNLLELGLTVMTKTSLRLNIF
jgi:radical SAM superfamily enzyme